MGGETGWGPGEVAVVDQIAVHDGGGGVGVGGLGGGERRVVHL
jgi:hypothetical protein